MWWYTLGVIVLWVINPELRRIYGWRLGFSGSDLLAVIPIIALVPHVWSLTIGGGWRRLSSVLSWAAWVWIGSFVYALLLSVCSSNLLPGSYSFATFVLPIGVGLWIAADEAPFAVAYKRVTRTLFAITTFICMYGVFQYIVAPAWDVAWLQSVILAGNTTFGLPFPFQMRVFSTLSSPGPFASFLAFMLVLALPELSLRKPLLLLQMPIWLSAFGLSLVRTGWIMFALGALTYLLLTPRRSKAIAGLTLASALVFGLAVGLPAALGNEQIATSLIGRFTSLTNLENDASRKARQELYDSASEMIGAAPFGQGLGVIGTSTKLSAKAAATDFDSGFLGRAVEMGLPGFILYLASLVGLISASAKVWIQARSQNHQNLQAIAAIAIAIQVAFAFEQLGGDGNGLPVLVVWLVDCLAVSALWAIPKPSLRVALA